MEAGGDGAGYAGGVKGPAGLAPCPPGLLRVAGEVAPQLRGEVRAIRALGAISSALCTTTRGAGPLLESLARAAAQSLDASWVALAFTQPVFLDQCPSVVLRHPDGRILHSWSGVPESLDRLVAELLSMPPEATLGEPATCLRAATEVTATETPGRGGMLLGASMCFAGETIGALAVELPPGGPVDGASGALVSTLASYGALALDNAFSFQERERLREVAEVASRQAVDRATSLAEREAELHLVREHLDQLHQRHLIADERERIAAELHDSVAQHLMAFGMGLDWCCQKLGEPQAVRDRLVELHRMAATALEEVRAAIFRLSPLGPDDTGLPGALRELAEEVARTGGLEATLDLAPTGAMPAAVERVLYYAAEEALFNVVRHAGATHAWLRLTKRRSSVTLIVSDDGTGDPERLGAFIASGWAPEHRGLSQVAWRARSLGGRSEVSRRPGGGISLEVRLPLSRRASEGQELRQDPDRPDEPTR